MKEPKERKEDKDVYRGEILVSTVRKESGFEKHVYTKDTFVKDGRIHMDTEGAELALKYDIDKIDKFVKSGIISPGDGKKLKDDIFSLEQQMEVWMLWKKDNPSATEEESNKAFHELTGVASFDEAKVKKTDELNVAIRKLIAQKDSIEPEIMESLPELFKNINPEDCFAITKPIMDRIYHLPELLRSATAKQISGDQWVIESKVDNRGTGPIGLSHNFRAKDEVDAKKYLEQYRHWMRGEGLKTLTAFWKTSCERGWFQFSSPIVEVMQQTADNKRKMHFSVKERQKFWAATRKLENTKLTLELHFPHARRKKEQKLVIEHRLVDVGARVHDFDEDSYPNDIMVKVLNPNDFQQLSQIGTAIHNNTVKLHPKDILLALSLQTRKAQREKHKVMTYDENALLDRANQEKTAKSNKRKARSSLKKKLNTLKDKEVIKDFLVDGKNYHIEGVSQKKTD